MAQVYDGRHQHAIVQFLKHDIGRTDIVVYQGTGVNKRQTAQHAQNYLHGVFQVERAVLPDRIKEQHATVVFRNQIMEDLVAFFHLAIVDKTHHIDIVIGIQFLAELNLVHLLALKKLFLGNALEFVQFHEIHHVVRTEHRIGFSDKAFLDKRVDDILANLLPFFESFHTRLFVGAKFTIFFDLRKGERKFFL